MSARREGALSQFQDAFARALVTEEPAHPEPGLARVTAQPGFAVYRNTVLKGCIDALRANFPAVHRFAGEEWFQAAAAVYARSSLPRTPSLFNYGAEFPEFLATFGPATELPYVVPVAKLDRLWTEAHIAPDETPLDAACIASLDIDALASRVLRPHASARWASFDGPAVTIWRRNRYDDTVDLSDLVCCRESVLIVRPHREVTNLDLDAAHCAFLDACAAGEDLARAAARSLAIDRACDLAQLMMRLLRSGAFAALDQTCPDGKEND